METHTYAKKILDNCKDYEELFSDFFIEGLMKKKKNSF